MVHLLKDRNERVWFGEYPMNEITGAQLDSDIVYADFADEIDAVLRTAIVTDTVMELNTRRLGDREALEKLEPIYRRYKEMGGHFVTLGSDAHGADAIGAHMQIACDFAEKDWHCRNLD